MVMGVNVLFILGFLLLSAMNAFAYDGKQKCVGLP